MFAKLFNKNPQQASPPVDDDPKLKDFEPRVIVHYGIPSTASILAFDPLQHLLAIGTLDGRIKVLGGDNIECLLISPNPVPYKNLEFLQNQGFLVSVSNENIIQVWDLEKRLLAAFLQWGSNISAFSVVCGTNYMYVGDEYGYLSVLKYDFEEGNILPMPYQIPPDLIADGSGIQIPEHQSVVGLLAQPCSSGKRVLIAYQNGLMIMWDVSEDKSILIRAHKDLQLKDDIIIRSTGEMKRENINNKSDDEQQSEKEISALCWVSSDGSILAVGYVDGDISLWNLSTNNQKTNKNTKNAIKLRFSSSDKRLPVIVLHWCPNSQNNGSGQLFVYGGDDIGSEEVLTAAVLDVQSSSVLYLTDILVNPSSPIVSMTLKRYLQSDTNDNEQSGNTSTSDSETEVAFLLTKDSHIIFLDSNNGNKICSSSVNPKESPAISLYILDESFPVPELPEENPTNSSQETTNEKDSSKSTEPESESTEAEESTSSQPTELWKNFVDSLILICCEDSLLLHSTKSLIQGKQNFICKIDLEKRCCWTTIFKKNEEESGVVLVYSTGIIEIRSLPDLKVVAETSLMSVLRWNFKTKMENTMSSFGNGHISMVYGCEFAVVSLFSSENDFRIPEALPRLHDKVVAEAAEAAYKFALSQKKQTAPTGILGGIIKNIKRDKGNETETIEETRDVLVPKLEALFSRTPFSVSDLDLDLDLGEDDNFDMPTKLVVERIEVEPKNPSPPSPAPIPSPDKNKKTERDRLLEGGSEPKARTTDEIKAKYRKSDAAGAAAAALEAKDKLLERQQKLEKLKENAEELESGSENFASMIRWQNSLQSKWKIASGGSCE